MLLLASLAWADTDFAADFAACQEAAPGSQAAAQCAPRQAWLEAHQDPDSTWSSLSALEDVRQRYTTLPPAQAMARVESIWQDPTASPRVRSEAGVWLARELLDRRGDPAAALPYTTALMARALDADLRRQGVDLHSRALAGVGRIAEAQALEEEAAPSRSARAREGLPLLLLQRRRARIGQVSAAVLGVGAVALVPLAVRGWARRPRPRPLGLIPLSVTLAGLAAISALRDPASLAAFAWLSAGLITIHLATAGALLSCSAPRWRVLIQLLAAATSLAAGYLSLQHTGNLEVAGL